MLHDPLARCLEISQPLRQSWTRDLIPLSSLSISLVHTNTNQNSNSTFEVLYRSILQIFSIAFLVWQEMTTLDEIIFPVCASLKFATKLIFFCFNFIFKAGIFQEHWQNIWAHFASCFCLLNI